MFRSRTLVLATALLAAACSSRVLSSAPVGDGAGPIGGGQGGSGSTSPPGAQPPSGDPGTGSGSGGGGSSGSSSGAGGAGGSSGTGAGSGSGGGSGSSSGGIGGSSSGGTGGYDGGVPTGADASTQDGSPGPDASAGDGGISALRQLCVDEINQVREQNGAPPYTTASDLEAYAATAAASDAQTGTRHGYFYQTNGGGGVASTEDELDGAMVDPGADAQTTFETGLQQDVQAQGAAYDNLVTPQLSQVGCGFAQDAGGNWWIVIALR